MEEGRRGGMSRQKELDGVEEEGGGGEEGATTTSARVFEA